MQELFQNKNFVPTMFRYRSSPAFLPSVIDDRLPQPDYPVNTGTSCRSEEKTFRCGRCLCSVPVSQVRGHLTNCGR